MERSEHPAKLLEEALAECGTRADWEALPPERQEEWLRFVAAGAFRSSRQRRARDTAEAAADGGLTYLLPSPPSRFAVVAELVGDTFLGLLPWGL